VCGKTTLMRATRVAWEAAGHTVAGAATQAVAAQQLQAETGIAARTVASWRWVGLAGVDVLVLDEASLTEDRDRAWLYAAAARTGTKLVEIGDPRQLRGVGCGSVFARVHELTASVADQPPAAVGPEDGAAVPAEDAAMDEAADHGPADAAPEGAAAVATRHREHRFPGRRRPVQVRFGEEEFAAIELAAGRAGLTLTGYVGAVALATARGTVPPTPSQSREALTELMAARAQVRRFGGNVNQAVAALNSIGETPQWLAQAVELTSRAVRQVDAAAEQLMRRRA
jgi:AAA domain